MKWLQAFTIVAGLTIANFGWQYFGASPDYAHAALQSYENAVGIITYIIVIAL